MSADYMYLRPNPNDNSNATPAAAPYCRCPDIWVAGTTPVANFQTALATAASYATMSQSDIDIGYSNYFYVRAMNGGSGDTEQYTVTMYYSPTSIINWPSQWQSQTIPTDSGSATGTLAAGVAPGSVGVCEDTFLWAAVPQPASGVHYCVFAQLNDAANSNPFPTITSSFGMGTIIQNNLLWGWRNTVDVASNVPSSSQTVAIAIPTTVSNPGNIYDFGIECTNMIGWSVALSCSQTDSDGAPISIPETTITEASQTIEAPTSNTLLPGYSAMLTVSCYSNGNAPPTGATFEAVCNYQTTAAEEAEAKRLGLKLDYRTRDAAIGPTAWLCIGGQTFNLTS